ncbi:helix-turn-helix domain-containing protein [Streptomyces sp. NPDC006334]|uniref:helix-turn-helix domain-containing protein n=1 Tax=Streptomyces sp. NPDC006334 TaxID=3156754 RepID=UPI0033AAFDE2
MFGSSYQLESRLPADAGPGLCVGRRPGTTAGEDTEHEHHSPSAAQREAATACGVSRTTIRRRREAGELPGSVLDDERGWLIPVDDLLAAGFRLHAPAPPDKAGADEATAEARQTNGSGECAPNSSGCGTNTNGSSLRAALPRPDRGRGTASQGASGGTSGAHRGPAAGSCGADAGAGAGGHPPACSPCCGPGRA